MLKLAKLLFVATLWFFSGQKLGMPEQAHAETVASPSMGSADLICNASLEGREVPTVVRAPLVATQAPVAPSPARQTGKILTQDQRNAFMARARRGDVVLNQGRDALFAAESLSRRLNSPVVGSGLNTCYMSFGATAVATVNQLLIAAKAATNPTELKSILVRNYARIMRVSEATAAQRVCTLAGEGANGTPMCKIFGTAVAMTCRR